MGDQPTLTFDVAYPAKLNRLTTFFRFILVIPHFIVLSIFGIALYVTTLIAWFAILITGKYPRGLWDFGMSVSRYGARVTAYYWYLRDEFPPFGGSGDYPVTFELDYPDHLSRWKIFVKGILLIPHIIVLYLLFLALAVVTLISWFAILFTGTYPEGMFKFVTGVLRWQLRVNVYASLLTDAYPPFSMDKLPAGTGYASGMA